MRVSLLPLVAAIWPLPAFANFGQELNIAFKSSPGSLQLADGSSSPTIILDKHDSPSVLRAAGDLAKDFGRVTGVEGATVQIDGSRKSATGSIIAGSLTNSSLIHDLVKRGKIDVSEIDGEWEAYTTKIVKSPLPGIESALVIAGSDRRGTIYGLYDISEQIGVSPYYFWADVPTKKHDNIFAKDIIKVQGSPSVKYRGIFINDEGPALTAWANAIYGETKYGSPFAHEVYEKVFELLLRLRANYLWPAMWASMFNVDDKLNPVTAELYGIVMGTSHTEPMARATNEWEEFGTGDWQWNTNKKNIKPFFVEGAKRAKPFENLFTMAMRGVHDTAIGPTPQIHLLENVVAAQRKILKQVYGDETNVPQLWCLYKEVQAYYDQGMRVPDDMTLLWADDNFGNIRRLPKEDEWNRTGGAGVYYHFDYVGIPRNYKWINQVQLLKTWQQMDMAYKRHARQIWVVNVGDIKPMEIPLNHFFDMAYDITKFEHSESTTHWLKHWASREFGSESGEEIGAIVDTYNFLANRRKYELLHESTYSLIYYNEAEKVSNEWKSLADKAQQAYDSLPEDFQAAFFEMILHPVLAGQNTHDLYINTAKNRLYASQGRTSTNALANQVLGLFENDRDLTERFHNLLEGKWDHVMDQTHLGYEWWQQPKRQSSPAIQYIIPRERAISGDMALMVQGSNASVPGDDPYHENNGITLNTMTLDPYGATSTWIEIFSVGTNVFDYTITAEHDFVQISKPHGTIAPTPNGQISDTRVYLSVDWDSCPEGSGTVTLNVSSSRGYGLGNQYHMPSVYLKYDNRKVPGGFSGHVESDGYLSFEAAHYSRVSKTSTPAKYLNLPRYGKSRSGMALYPVNLDSQTTSDGPALEFDFYTFDNAKDAEITTLLSPALNTNPDRPLRFAIAIDDGEPTTEQYVHDLAKGDPPAENWEPAVANEGWEIKTTADVSKGKHTLKFWALEPGVILEKIMIDLGGLEYTYLGAPESTRVSAD